MDMKHPKDYVKVTKFGYEVYHNRKQIGAGVGVSILSFLNIKYPSNKMEKGMARRGIYLLKDKE